MKSFSWGTNYVVIITVSSEDSAIIHSVRGKFNIYGNLNISSFDCHRDMKSQ